MIQIGCAGEGQVSGRLQKNFGQRLKCGEYRCRIDVIKLALPAQTHAPIAIHFAFRVSRTSFLDCLAHFARLALQNFSARRSFLAHRLLSAKKAI